METTPSASRRPSFLLSALVHVIMITLVIRTATKSTPVPTTPALVSAQPPARDRTVFLPPPAELRRMMAPTRRPAAPLPQPEPAIPPRLVLPDRQPLPTPTPEAREGIRVGSRDGERAQRPLLLPRDGELASGNTPMAGRPGVAPTPTPEPPRLGREERPGIGGPGSDPQPAQPDPGRPARAGRENDAPLGPDGRPRARPGVQPTAPPAPGGQRSIAESLRRLEQQLGQAGNTGTAGVSGRQMGPLFFDPEGADFTGWVNHFKNEVYRNWIVPQAALFGAVRGHVDFAFTVDRDGTIAEVRLVKSSGTAALDRAAANALFGARLLPLPSDFGPAQVTMQISFFYGAERS